MNEILVNQPMFDWLTYTSFSNMDDELQQIVDDNNLVLAERGTKRLNRYVGDLFGDSLFYGMGEQRGVAHWAMIASGGFADDVWHSVGASFTRVSRMDVQITIEWPNVVMGWYLSLKRENRSVEIAESRSGTTLYIGSRTSGRFCRIYVKADGLLRCEFELKEQIGEMAGKSGHGAGAIFLSELSRLIKKVEGVDSGLDSFLDTCYDIASRSATGDVDTKTARPVPNTMRWLKTTVDSAINKCWNDHDMREDCEEWLTDLLSRLYNGR